MSNDQRKYVFTVARVCLALIYTYLTVAFGQAACDLYRDASTVGVIVTVPLAAMCFITAVRELTPVLDIVWYGHVTKSR